MSLEQSVVSVLERQTDRFYGKYRGLVLVSEDPRKQGRIQALVPEILGTVPTNWCLPCTPYAGAGAGLFTIPVPGSGVWVEFEAGDVNRPVWTGCWWGTAEIPLNETGGPSLFTNKTLRTDTGLTISLDDASQKITITDALGANLLSMQAGRTTLTSKVVITMDAPQILHGGQGALPHPAVLGDQLLTYLNQMVLMFNTHTHPGELAVGMLPVTPAPPLPPMPPATPTLLSLKNFVG
jgi:hypothetical protein